MQGASSKAIKIAAHSKHSEELRSPCGDCGVSYKVSNMPRLVDGYHTQFEYTIKYGILWYDVSFVNCAKKKNAASCPAHAQGVAMYSSQVRIPEDLTSPIYQPPSLILLTQHREDANKSVVLLAHTAPRNLITLTSRS